MPPPRALDRGPGRADPPGQAPLRVLILTKVFPNAVDPLAAAFSRQQFAALAQLPQVQTVEIVAPVPWFPGAHLGGARTGAGKWHAVPDFEWIDGLFVRHPRVLHLPRIDYAAAAALTVASLYPRMRRWRGRFDVILGSFAYPDGVAATWMARRLGIPAVVAALGSDIHVTAKIRGVAAQLAHALARASRVVAVSRDLAAQLTALGAPPARLVVVDNGIDRGLFHPGDRTQARRRLGHGDDAAPWILFVGRLENSKGIADLLQAMPAVVAAGSEAKLILLGEGRARAACEAAVAAWPGRILVMGGRPLAEVAIWMTACDLVTLPSHSEGTPNVLLEALATGRKVVATRVGGIPDVIDSSARGELVPPGDPGALTAALLRGLADRGDPAVVAASAAASTPSWQQSAARLCDVLQAAVADPVGDDLPRP